MMEGDVMNHNINAVPVNVDTSLLNQTVKQTDKPVDKSSAIDTQTILAEKLAKIELDKTKDVQAESEINAKNNEEAEVEEALDIVSTFVNSAIKRVDFTTDSSSGKMVIKVTDKQTQEIIQQFPSEKLISMAEKIKELQQDMQGLTGLLIDSHI